MDDAPAREVDVLRAAVARVEAVLPPTWQVQLSTETGASTRFDAVLGLEAPDGSRVTQIVEVKRTISTRDVPSLLEQLRLAVGGSQFPDTGVALVARYLSPNTRRRIEADGAGYIDATGNIRLSSDRPSLFLAVSGADRDPWRGPGRPRGSLRGAPAARVVRALVDIAPPYSVPELIKSSGTSTGATYRVVKYLEEEGFIEREQRGPIRDVAWRRLLVRWSEDYGFDRADSVQAYVAPRGIDAAAERLRGSDAGYAVTGSVAAQFYAPYAPPRLLMLYAQQPPEVASIADLRPVETGGNVLIAANEDDFALMGTTEPSGLKVAPPSQIVVDLLSGPGRSPAEAEVLLDWMERNEDAWRRR